VAEVILKLVGYSLEQMWIDPAISIMLLYHISYHAHEIHYHFNSFNALNILHTKAKKLKITEYPRLPVIGKGLARRRLNVLYLMILND